MKTLFGRYFFVVYTLVVVCDLLATAFDSFYANAIFKPAIVVSLLLYIRFSNTVRDAVLRFAVGGLSLSLVGDVLLLFQEQNSLFFILGLVSFLLAHVFFILYYVRSSGTPSPVKWKRKPLLMLLFVMYGLGFAAYLNPYLGALRVPVFAYAAVLVSMNISALNRFGKVAPDNFRLVIAGALFFTLSDSLLAVNKFVHPLPLAGIAIMITYALAQYLITRSTLTPVEEQGVLTQTP